PAPIAESFLVSTDFYDIEASWGTPAGRASDRADASEGAVLADFHPTRAARALIAVYQRLLGER
ncbi:MAG: hypothetical protein ACOCX2_05880, partial [Armatimonadota bacterium]